MDAVKAARIAQVIAQAFLQFVGHLVGRARQLFRPVFGKFRHRRLGRIPEAGTVLVEIGGRTGESAQGVAEHGGRFTRHDTTELHAQVLDAPVRGGRRGRRTQVDGARHAPGRRQFAQVRLFRVYLQWQGIRPVHVFFDNRRPVVGKIAGQFGLHPGIFNGNRRRQDQRRPVAPLPQAVDDRRHEAQHAPGALKFRQRGPAAVQLVENLRVDGVRRLDAPFIVGVPAFRWKLGALVLVQFGEGLGRHIPLLEGIRPGQRLEQPPPYNLEALFGGGGPPRGFQPSHHVPQPVQRLPAPDAAHLDIVRLRMGRARRVRGGQGNHKQAVTREFGRFRKDLGKAELGLEPARRQVALVVQLPRVGDPLVYEDQARAVFGKQGAEHIPGTGRLLIIGFHLCEGLLAAQLPRQFAPQRAHRRAVGLGHGIPRGYLVAHQYHPFRSGQGLYLRRFQRGVHPGEFRGGRSRKQVVQRQHGVGLAAAKIGLQLHHRVAARARETLHPVHQQPFQAFREIGAPEKFFRGFVLVGTFAQVHLPQVRGEFRLLIAAARHVRVGRRHLAPGFQRAACRRLDERTAQFLFLVTPLLVKHLAAQIQLDTAHLFGLRRRHGREQPLRRIQGAVRVVAGKGFLMRPLVAPVPHL